MKSIDKVEGTFDSRNRDKRGRPSQATIRRLPRYHRYLANLLSEGILRISSSALAERMHVTASQIRQDLSCFGDFGQQGYGYNVKYLYHKIGLLLGAEAGYRAVLVGVGNMGQALLRSRMFERRGVRCVAAFDRDPALVGRIIGDVTVLDGDTLEVFCREERVDLAILTLPADAAREVAPVLAAAGVQGVLNFANTELPRELPLRVENVHLDDALMLLCYEISSTDRQREEQNG
ncbi:MAG: redox-sensing transcriptional repressor Rex [Clostridia bacterium]|nr:redox-sensing transcriptional repressor Rex [Clostridia bacterium]